MYDLIHHTGCYQQPLKTFFFEPLAQCFQTQQSPHQSQNFRTFMEYEDPLSHTQEPTMNRSLGQMNPIHIISHLYKTQFNIFIPRKPTSAGSTLSLSFSGYYSVCIAKLSHVCATSQTHLISLHLKYLKMFAKKNI